MPTFTQSDAELIQLRIAKREELRRLHLTSIPDERAILCAAIQLGHVRAEMIRRGLEAEYMAGLVANQERVQ